MLIEAEVSGDIDEMLTLFKDSPKKSQTAINRAVRKLSRWAERQVLRDMSSRLEITQKILKNLKRIKIEINKGSSGQRYLTLWIGTLEVAAHRLGKLRQDDLGTHVGRGRFYRSAFLMQPVEASTDLIWNRTENWSHKYRRSKKSGRWMWMGLPIVKKTEPIIEEAEASLKKLQPALIDRFTDLLYQELNYAFNVES